MLLLYILIELHFNPSYSYQFLAFDFDEPVEMTKDNCRLLFLRLKMEGWVLGKNKVFLRYYNDEFLAR